MPKENNNGFGKSQNLTSKIGSRVCADNAIVLDFHVGNILDFPDVSPVWIPSRHPSWFSRKSVVFPREF